MSQPSAWKSIQQGLIPALGNREAVPGAIVSVSTAGDMVNPHPHLHCIVSAGAWIGDSFAPWPDALTGERLEALFRRHVLKMLVRQERLEQDTADRLLQWGKSGFSVFVGEPIASHADESLLRLARYLVKPPVSLLSFSPLGPRARSGRADHTIPRPLLQREPGSSPQGNRDDQSAISPITPQPLPEPPSRKAFRLAWAALLSWVWGVDILRCPLCGGEQTPGWPASTSAATLSSSPCQCQITASLSSRGPACVSTPTGTTLPGTWSCTGGTTMVNSTIQAAHPNQMGDKCGEAYCGTTPSPGSSPTREIRPIGGPERVRARARKRSICVLRS